MPPNVLSSVELEIHLDSTKNTSADLSVVPASMLSFSRRAALSAAKYLLFSDFKSVSRSYFCVLDRPNFSIILSAG